MFLYWIATVSIIPLEPIILRGDIRCPGDIIPFNCSILSNSETIHLMWLFTIPEMMSKNVTYSNTTSGRDTLTPYLSTYVTDFQSDQYIHSTLEFTVQPGIPIDEFTLNCSISGLGFNTTVVHINSSSKIATIYYYYKYNVSFLQFRFLPLFLPSLRNIIIVIIVLWRLQFYLGGTHHRVAVLSLLCITTLSHFYLNHLTCQQKLLLPHCNWTLRCFTIRSTLSI